MVQIYVFIKLMEFAFDIDTRNRQRFNFHHTSILERGLDLLFNKKTIVKQT